MDLVPEPGLAFQMMTVITLTAGTMFLMWLGDQITERGIGNGMSLDHYGRHSRPASGGLIQAWRTFVPTRAGQRRPMSTRWCWS